MRRNVLWLLSTAAGLVMLFTYRPNSPGTESSAAPAVVATTPSSDSIGTYKGKLVQTHQGPVQVSITVSNGRIAEVTAVVYPSDSARHQQISGYALPLLRQAALQAQSADIDTVSGATDTSEGYIESLQAAIDAAHLS